MTKLYFARGELRVDAVSRGQDALEMHWAGSCLEKPDPMLLEFLGEVSSALKARRELHLNVDALGAVGSRLVATLLDWLCQQQSHLEKIHIRCGSAHGDNRYLVIALEALAEQMAFMPGAEATFEATG